MTKKLEALLNLPSIDEMIETQSPTSDCEVTYNESAEAALAMVDGADHTEACDKIYDETLKHAADLMDLGYNIDHARAARMFEVANTFYKTALDAKNAKRDAEFKKMKLALDQQKIELMKSNGKGDLIDPRDDSLIIEDRNELIRQLMEKKSTSSSHSGGGGGRGKDEEEI